MSKALALVLLAIGGVLYSMYFWIGVPVVYRHESLSPRAPHLYKNPSRPIEEVVVFAFYFVPQDKTPDPDSNWYGLLERNLRALAEFHSFQFQNRSQIKYKIFPTSVIGKENAVSYDTDVTNRGNPRALISIASEIEQRVFDRNGDLFSPDFLQADLTTYPVMFILYEGVGAVGGVIHESDMEDISEIAKKLGLPESVIFKVDVKSVEGFFLLNRQFLIGKYETIGASLLAHEFYHTLGIPDSYEGGSGAVTPDLMGFGRYQPIRQNFLEKQTLKELGF